ncbi:MAG: AMIN domain-containing protein [Gemmatimonadaceae bacterium]|jgi:type IV pilus assembly protein PilQ|nr:AMIN domain-containing protein [Gemmatimonadaceae bacterium]
MMIPTLEFSLARRLAVAACTLSACALVAAPLRAQATLHGVRVDVSTGRTLVALALDDSVTRSTFTLANPARLVVDLTGARLAAGAGAEGYDGTPRGPITNVRLSQYRPDVVRVVLDLASAARYEVTGGRTLQIALPGGGDAPVWAVGRSELPATGQAVAQETLVESRASAGRAAAGDAAVDPGERPAGRKPSARARLSVSYQDADIRDVIAAFASFANRTIVIGKDVNGSVTADVRDKPWDDALSAILTAQGLAASEEPNGIIIVDSYANILAKQSLEPLTTQVVSVNYANANTLARTVFNLLSFDCLPGASGATPQIASSNSASPGAPPALPQGCVRRGSVQSDSATNSLLIREVPSRIADVVSYVRSIDRRTPQVAIKAKIIFTNRSQIEEFGVSYDIGTPRQFFSAVIPRQEVTQRDPVDNNGDGVPDGFREILQPVMGDRVDLAGRSVSAVTNVNARVSQPAINLLYSAAIGKYSLTSFLQALQESRLADVQAEPTVTTLDNRVAEILVGQEIPIRVLDAGAAMGGGAQGGAGAQVNIPRATVNLKEVGIALRVTPRITNNRQVLMAIHAENSSASLASSDVGFIFDKQRADNTLLVNDGETAVIGGLTVTEISRSRSGIPILMDLPLVGKLFGVTRKQEQKRDLLILVTPHIIDEGEPVRPATPPGR